MPEREATDNNHAAEEARGAVQPPVYTMLCRPVGSFTLPRGVTTTWVRLPRLDGHYMKRAFPTLETSRHMFGEFTTSRPLTKDELARFQVKRID